MKNNFLTLALVSSLLIAVNTEWSTPSKWLVSLISISMIINGIRDITNLICGEVKKHEA